MSKVDEMTGMELRIAFAECVMGHEVFRSDKTRTHYERQYRAGRRTLCHSLYSYEWSFDTACHGASKRFRSIELHMNGSKEWSANVDGSIACGDSPALAFARACIKAAMSDPTPTRGVERANS